MHPTPVADIDVADDSESNTELVHYIYSSAATVEFSQAEIVALLEQARKNNAAIGVTGGLLYDKGSFFQILEGEPDVLEALYSKIEQHPRHNRVTKIVEEPIDSLDFSEWTMGYAGVTKEQLASIEGLNDFLSSLGSYADLDEGRAKLLLNAFKKGKWRASID